jgi:hypothetical protein
MSSSPLISPALSTEMLTTLWRPPMSATALSVTRSRAGYCQSTPVRDAPKRTETSSRSELIWSGLTCARKPESKCAWITCRDKGTSTTAPRNQVSCLPTAASGTVLETNTGDGEAPVAARPCPVLPGEPVHPAAAPAITTLSKAHKIRLAALLLAGRATQSYDKPPAALTRLWRRLRSQNQFMPSRPSKWAWWDHSKQQRASAALTHDKGVIARYRDKDVWRARCVPYRAARRAYFPVTDETSGPDGHMRER